MRSSDWNWYVVINVKVSSLRLFVKKHLIPLIDYAGILWEKAALLLCRYGDCAKLTHSGKRLSFSIALPWLCNVWLKYLFVFHDFESPEAVWYRQLTTSVLLATSKCCGVNMYTLCYISPILEILHHKLLFP